MAQRKTLKQKLKSQVRAVNKMREEEFHNAGVAINFEVAVIQAVAMAHGVMATQLSAKATFGEDHEGYKQFEEQCQARIAQCYVKLVEMGIPADVANQRIIQGH